MTTRRYGRRTVDTSNEDKVLFPEAGLTKGALIDYYERIADEILPHLRERPLVLQRFPDGIGEDGFYQKQVGDYFPDWITTVRVDVSRSDGRQELVVCDAKATLGYLANQACITLHACFAKLTGSKGVHVVAPLDRSADFDTVRRFATDAMSLLASRHPDALTTEQRKNKRRGRVYLDVGRNAYGQTAVAPWSVRPLPEAPVAATVRWSDLEQSGIGPRDFTVRNVFRKIANRDDPWSGWRRRARSIAPARERLDRLRDA